MESRFTIFINHGGEFIQNGSNPQYDGFGFKMLHDLDPDFFGYFDLVDAVDKLGYESWEKFYYKIPGVTNDMKIVSDDKGVMEMLSFVTKGEKCIEVYVDGCKEEEFAGEPNMTENDVVGPENDEDSSEDEDYMPMEMSSSEGSDCEHDLASEDEEYVEARSTIAKYKIWKQTEDANLFLINDQQLALCERMESDYENSDCALRSMASSSDEGDDFDSGRPSAGRKRNMIIYDPTCDHKKLEFVLGMRFETIEQCRSVVQKVAILNGYDLKNLRTTKKHVEARCVDGCPWRLYASAIKSEGMVAIKRLVADHKCSRNMHTRQATADWIAHEYLNTFRTNPNMTIAQLAEDILRNFAVEPTKWKLYRGKWKALDMLRGSVTGHYALLRSYMAELQRVDREGRFEFLLGDGSVFKAFYIGFSALRKGFLQGCRPIIGFDGCFLKTFLGGALLCATAKDGNNQMYPIAWAVVEAENQSCWMWFLRILFEDLGITDGLGYSFVSDQQKGLMNAIMELTPYAEHRNCARHVYMNWKKQFKGQVLKSIFWRIVLSTHISSYNSALEDLKAEDEGSYLDFLDRIPSRFCKSFISTIPRCDMIENNISETFNGYIVKSRGKHIIDMLECIRSELMKRQYTKLQEISGVTDSICPRIRLKLEENKYKSRMCVTKPAVGDKFQVACNDDQFVVDLSQRACSCRYWDISGIPCIHASSAIHFLHKDVADFVHEYYSVQKYISMYSVALKPLNGKKIWHVAHGYPIKPPPFRKMSGRTKKKRKIAPEEEKKSATKLKRFGLKMTCQNCLGKGHNKKTCTRDAVQKPPKGKRGRPRKDGSTEAPSSSVTERDPSSNFVGRAKKLQVRKNLRAVGNSVIQKERAVARKGYGVLKSESTGNTYMRMSNDRRVHVIPPNMASNSTARGGSSTRGGSNARGGSSARGGLTVIENNLGTQESIANS